MATEKGVDDTQFKEAFTALKRTVAEKVTGILSSWEKLSKEEIRVWLSTFRDDLIGMNQPFIAAGHAFRVLDQASINITEEGRIKNGKMPDDAQYRKAVDAMENGDLRAKTKVAFHNLSGVGGVEVDADKAVVLLEERAKDKDSEAKWMLGLCYEHGKGTERDIERAEKLYGESSKAGNAVGEFLSNNGKYNRGSGVMRVNSS